MTLAWPAISPGIEFRLEHLGTLFVLYVGPDQILPLTSVLGALVGIILICWRYVVALAGKVRQFFSRR
jgi:hypothetical protein